MKRLSLQEVKNLQAQSIAMPAGYALPKEKAGRKDLIQKGRDHGWLIVPIHCDEYLKGFPDTIWYHAVHGTKHVETKSCRPGHGLEDTQCVMFLKMHQHGAKIYVLQHADQYDLLFKEPNWTEFLPMNLKGG